MTVAIEEISAFGLFQAQSFENPSSPRPHDGGSEKFRTKVEEAQEIVKSFWRFTAYVASRQADPQKAAETWRQYASMCEALAKPLQANMDQVQALGLECIYEEILAYKEQALERFRESMEEAECVSNPILERLFPPENCSS